MICFLTTFADHAEGMTDITPMLIFIGKFFVAFGLIALMAVLTPKIAAKVDKIRENHKQKHPDDPNCSRVRGIYDLPPMPKTQPEADADSAEKDVET